ncbi:MAG: hypothetical protein GY711_19545 [bacterium]|nr:hypothetical protein [bacterium]
MPRAPLSIAWPVSLALLLPGGPLADWDVSRTAWIALAWTACAGVPAARRIPVVGELARTFALACGPLAVAVAVDRAAGLELGVVLGTAAIGSAMCAALVVAACSGSRVYAAGYLVWILGLPLYSSVFGWGVAGAPLAGVRDASPLAWLYGRGLGGAAAPPALALGSCALLIVVAFAPGARDEREPDEVGAA